MAEFINPFLPFIMFADEFSQHDLVSLRNTNGVVEASMVPFGASALLRDQWGQLQGEITHLANGLDVIRDGFGQQLGTVSHHEHQDQIRDELGNIVGMVDHSAAHQTVFRDELGRAQVLLHDHGLESFISDNLGHNLGYVD